MNERTMKLRLGAAVVLSLVIIMILLTFLGSREKLSTAGYEIKIQMVDAPNVMANTPIYQSGILIGRVTKVELTETNGVFVTARIYDDHKLYHDQECHLVSSLLGDASLRMITRQTEETDQTRHTEIKPGEVIQGETTLDPALLMAQMQETLAKTINDVTTASVELSRVAATTNGILIENRENVAEIMGNARLITGNTAQVMMNLSGIMTEDFCNDIQDAVGNLKEAAVKFPGTIDKVNKTLDNVQDTVTLSNKTIGKLASGFDAMSPQMKNSLDKIEQIMINADVTIANMRQLSTVFADEKKMGKLRDKIENIVTNADSVLEQLNRGDTTLGLLLHDRALYDRLQTTLDKVGSLPDQLEPILFNAQVMSEKLARHPELLGLRGYLKPDSGTSGTIPWPKGVRPSIQSYAPSSWNSAPYSTPIQHQMPVPVSGNWRDPEPLGAGPVSVPQAVETAPQTSDASVFPGVVKTNGMAGVRDPDGLNGSAWKNAENRLDLKPAETAPETELAGNGNGNGNGDFPAASRSMPQNVQIPEDARLITPEMVGMTPEEFQNADPALLSDAIWDAVAVSDREAELPKKTAVSVETEDQEIQEVGSSLAELSISGFPASDVPSAENRSELSPEPLTAPVNPAAGNQPVME